MAKHKLPMRGAWDLYRLRWQIELVFKRWKSLGHCRSMASDALRAECSCMGVGGVVLVDFIGNVAVRYYRVCRPGVGGRSCTVAPQIVGVVGRLARCLERVDLRLTAAPDNPRETMPQYPTTLVPRYTYELTAALWG